MQSPDIHSIDDIKNNLWYRICNKLGLAQYRWPKFALLIVAVLGGLTPLVADIYSHGTEELLFWLISYPILYLTIYVQCKLPKTVPRLYKVIVSAMRLVQDAFTIILLVYGFIIIFVSIAKSFYVCIGWFDPVFPSESKTNLLFGTFFVAVLGIIPSISAIIKSYMQSRDARWIHSEGVIMHFTTLLILGWIIWLQFMEVQSHNFMTDNVTSSVAPEYRDYLKKYLAADVINFSIMPSILLASIIELAVNWYNVNKKYLEVIDR